MTADEEAETVDLLVTLQRSINRHKASRAEAQAAQEPRSTPPEGQDTRETAQSNSAPRDPEPNQAQCEAISRWLYDESDTRTVGELRAHLRSLGDGVHPRSVDPR